ncbi:hypothetical protein AB0285_13895, partial [Microbacterium oleivorans]|uniref:hypothetical protein n=1 Tax=Microbacterium oleivorans TaxID=273677 RepID=UPI00344C7691
GFGGGFRWICDLSSGVAAFCAVQVTGLSGGLLVIAHSDACRVGEVIWVVPLFVGKHGSAVTGIAICTVLGKVIAAGWMRCMWHS